MRSVIAVFLFAATGIAFVVGLALLFPGPLLDWLAQFNRPGMEAFRTAGRWAAALLVFVGCFAATAAAGLLRGKKWAWWMAVGLFAVNGCGDVVGYALTRDAWHSGSGIVICSVFVYALLRIRHSFH